jgi:tripartite-type tricarboxylate transporter receptor subunit TctC
MTNRPLLAIAFAGALLASSTADSADRYPVRPVRVIVPFAAGGTFDLVARVVAQQLTDLWRQQVIVENRPGGATIIAAELTANATPDGYTMLLSPNSLAANPALHKKLPYDTQRDFRPLVLIATQSMALGTNLSFKANSIRDLIALAKAEPGLLAYGTAGIGSGGHLAGEIFKSMAGIDVTHVSYKGGNLAMLDVIANQIPLVMTGLPNLLPLQRAGKIRILGITDTKRATVAPEIPTIAETVPRYEFRNWFGLVAPGAIATDLVRRINADVNTVLADVGTRQRLLEQGFDVIGGSAQEFDALVKADTLKFDKVIRDAGIQIN